MIYIGLDLHDKNTTVAIATDRRSLVDARPRELLTNQVVEFLSHFPIAEARVALEAGGGRSNLIAQELVDHGFDVLIVDPFKARRMLDALANDKNDRGDAEGLAELLARGMLDHIRVWLPDQYTRCLRELTRGRRQFVTDGTRVRNRIRRCLARQGLRCKYNDLMGKAAQNWLREIRTQVPFEVGMLLSMLNAQLCCIVEQVAECEAAIEEMVKDNPMVALLRTIPGIGPVLSATIAAEIGDITRFDAARFLRGYSGLVPITRQSGERSYTGPLRLRGNPHLRWALIQAAMGFANTSTAKELSLRKWHSKHVFAQGPNPARVALARKLCDIIFAMLRDGTEFEVQRYLPAA